ncbi:MAG: GNAT family N-acetyltransferase [Anaerolineae bacterium]|nr:GNAT family N-acetyltransferase [Anaerolineae bacterium]
MGKEKLVLREFDLERDAPKMAEMMKASDDQWPGTWSGGAEITTEMITEWHERGSALNRWIFEVDNKMIAYCSFHEMEEEKNAGYVGLLNVQPEYQGRSLGRRLLQKSIERCSELGYHMLSLYTWSGNLKSVPLYKKTGFFWMPDTSVWMLNYVPGILSQPCAQPYFSKHDWYQTSKRELNQVEDKQLWEGIKVFTYHWESDGDSLTAWIDREARKLTAIETDAFFAGAIAANIEPAKGMSTTMRWRLVNKQDHPMSVSLLASGDEHIQIDHRATVTVAPGETTELEASVDIAADTPDVKRHKAVPAVRTILIIDGEVLELGTGLHPRPAVEIDTSPHHVTLFPGVPKIVHLQLRSRLEQDVQATISLAPASGLNVDRTEHTIAIPSKSFAALPVELVADDGGVYELSATIYFEGGKTLPERLPIFCLPAGGVLAYQGAKETRIENEWTRVVLKNQGGEAFIDAVQDNVGLGGFGERLGPPFWPSELDDKTFRIELERDGGRVTALMSADLEESYPELTLYRRVTLSGGPLIELAHTLANNSTETYRLQVSAGVRYWHNDASTITVPLKGGIVHSYKPEFPAVDEDIGKTPEAFAERWAAFSSRWGTLGVLWETSVEENEVGWGVSLLTPELACEPQQRVPASRLYIYAGPGDWRTVRKHARRLAGTDDDPEPIPVQARQVHDARIEPAPLVTVDDQVTATFTVDNLRRRPLKGHARLLLPQGLSSDRDRFELHDISCDRPLSEPIVLALAPTAAAYEGSVDLGTQLADTRVQVPVIRLGNRSDVTVAKHEQEGATRYAIDNGRTRFDVAPGFCGALVRWQENGVNHVISSFPGRKTFGWMSPWYGGITPLVVEEHRSFPGHLEQETLSGQIIDLPDWRGIPWRGVRVSAEITREDLVGLRAELDYLTVGQSNVLKLVCRVHNATSGKRRLVVGWLTFWQPDGSCEANVLRSAYVERKPMPWESWSWARHWATVTNNTTGRTAILVSPYPDVCAMDWGDPGGHLGCWSHVDVLPESTTERVCYVALCNELEQAKRYTWLKDYLEHNS